MRQIYVVDKLSFLLLRWTFSAISTFVDIGPRVWGKNRVGEGNPWAMCGKNWSKKPSMSMGFLKYSILGIHRKGYLSFTPVLVQHWTNQPTWSRFTLRRPFLREFRGSHIGSEIPSGHQRWQTKKTYDFGINGLMYQSVYINGPPIELLCQITIGDHQKMRDFKNNLTRIDLEKWGATKWMTIWQGVPGHGPVIQHVHGSFSIILGKGWQGATLKQTQRQIKTQGQVIGPVQRQAPGGKGAVPLPKLGWKSKKPSSYLR